MTADLIHSTALIRQNITDRPSESWKLKDWPKRAHLRQAAVKLAHDIFYRHECSQEGI